MGKKLEWKSYHCASQRGNQQFVPIHAGRVAYRPMAALS
jgi:hypothetical protein